MNQKIIDLFDKYTHGGMNRRDFLERLTLMAGSATAVTAILPVLENNYAQAEVVPENDPVIKTETTEIAPGISGYLVRPAAEGTYPAVLVIHENRGLNPHIKDVTRRMAKEGFIAFGGDYLTAMGGTPSRSSCRMVSIWPRIALRSVCMAATSSSVSARRASIAT